MVGKPGCSACLRAVCLPVHLVTSISSPASARWKHNLQHRALQLHRTQQSNKRSSRSRGHADSTRFARASEQFGAKSCEPLKEHCSSVTEREARQDSHEPDGFSRGMLGEKQIQIDRKLHSSQRDPSHKEMDLNVKHSPGFVVFQTRGLGGPIAQMKTRCRELL